MSAISMSLVSLTFHQIVRSLGPVVTLGLEWLLGVPLPSSGTMASLAMVVVGVGCTSIGDIEFSSWGALLTVVSVLLACVKGLATNRFLVGPNRLGESDLLQRMSALAVLQCVCVAWWVGELDGVAQWTASAVKSAEPIRLQIGSMNVSTVPLPLPVPFLHLLSNSILALLVNLSSFGASRHLGPVGSSVAANVKQVATVVVGVVVFHYSINSWIIVGVALTICGGWMYAQNRTAEKKKKE
ncbi:hypothetical protein M427DRAFT_52752 [Gonapodya prolifera JEL478]|uniref:Sugar phosphate transporter domain-containing protein n=1 Tax=Gonapodya prolifera (strain JEL478) TaxID=1344416 RepID=A0A139AT74_GONPJ|nr:hypothetical protein M427DRAFT_52752 [Gonapodya prolifera JEL478]|eukprot:KXS19932.1 hypothetical protein M427DRAFT_52752 [Gonapodya prolifera JEL478]